MYAILSIGFHQKRAFNASTDRFSPIRSKETSPETAQTGDLLGLAVRGISADNHSVYQHLCAFSGASDCLVRSPTR